MLDYMDQLGIDQRVFFTNLNKQWVFLSART